MTIPSEFSAKGLSIRVSVPLVQGDDVVGNYADLVSNYSHAISANGGYLSAEFTVSGNNEFVESWLQSGIGRHIEIFGPQLQTIWEGFVNQIEANMGGATFSVGPLTNVGNFVWGIYTPLIYDPNSGEPIQYSPMPTYAVRDDASVTKYGLWEKLINIGEVTPDDARYIRGLYLQENKEPEGNPSLAVADNSGELSVTVNCRGYIDWLSYIYNNDDETHVSVYLSTIIKDILTDDPNTIISASYDKIDTNLYIEDPYTTDNKTARTLIYNITAIGGGNDDRWTFGIYKDRKAVYSPIPTEVEYIYYKTGKTQQVETLSGKVLDPWEVVPCKWVAIPTFLTSFSYRINDIRTDPRVFFAEEVNFTAPDQVTISGAKIRKLSQFLAKLGLGGV
jgi:hypothetical protein